MNYAASSTLPPLRHDLCVVEIYPGLLRLYDEAGFTETSVQLPVDIIDSLLFMDGRRTGLEIASNAAGQGNPFDLDRFLEVVALLDQEGFLESDSFHRRREQIRREYNSLPVRPAAFAGLSYPEDPTELREFLDETLAEASTQSSESGPPTSLFIPHIDPQVGGAVYGSAYNLLRESDADTFILLGVPHRLSYDRFMFSTMDFDTPLGRVETDREFIEHFRSGLSFDLTTDQFAHMQEHSIEFQAIYLAHLFADRPIRIVPILLGSLYEYVEMGTGGVERDQKWTELYERLTMTAEELGRKVCWIASVDFCHVGEKFGDEYTARSVFPDVKRHDMELIDSALRGDAEAFISSLVAVRNHYKVCGVSPMYGLLRMVPHKRGELLAYDQFDESSRNSGVSFASVAFW